MFQPRKDKHPGFGLTAHDERNVKYLLGLTPEQIEEWKTNATIDDLLYAREIAEIYHILNVDKAVNEVGDFQAARWVLQKYVPVVQKPVAKQPEKRRLVAWLKSKLF
jgi:hypothetical protein